MSVRLPSDDTPFVLFDDARAGGTARLYAGPVEIVATRRSGEVTAALDALRTATRGGLHAAGFLSYDAGHALEPRLPAREGDGLPLLWFGLFRDFAEVDAGALLPDPAGGWLGALVPAIDRTAYDARLAEVQALIAAGDIYQANLTFQASVAIAGDPFALYAGLRVRAKAGCGAIVWTGRDRLLSLSPELFFEFDEGRITTRPMKGTALRDPDAQTDAAAAKRLAEDEKQRAENLMIVDLLRNDLSKVATPGSVETPELFAVESYPTVHQMTSTVTATLADGKDALDVLAALFPCGSITGAPKLRAMEVIDAVESAPRGAYTGAIGRIDAGAAGAAFNVAIRTLHLAANGAHATMGLGSGIVADSKGDDEWVECLGKGDFVASPARFDLIETMAFDPHAGVARLEAHLARMKASAEALGFAFDRHAARNELQAATFRLREPAKVRLLLSCKGAMAIETRALPPQPADAVLVALAPLPVSPPDFRLRHKTSDRAFYDDARHAGHAFEVIFEDASGRVTEGSFTHVFIERDGTLLTPPLSLGLLPGILRAELIAEGCASEADLTVADLAHGFLIGNAVRGLLPARLLRL
ncbi:MAG: aminodeoxychorismate synthase component I [Sphingomonadaceae bacterium]|nr:aminodeoxychorismate synthase component I [Sphingomonadaceae bacterium]